jgi:hypothetical protein
MNSPAYQRQAFVVADSATRQTVCCLQIVAKHLSVVLVGSDLGPCFVERRLILSDSDTRQHL